MEIVKLYSLFRQYPLIITDSRQAAPGSIFFALRGKTFNGNSFAKNAIDHGCEYAIIDDEQFSIPGKCILVNDSLHTLQGLARYHRKQKHIPFLAITGSNGKTTTKELVACILSTSYKVHFTQGNLNNHIGVPLTLLSMPDDLEFAVIEMGANHPGEIGLLCKIAEPTHGMITNIGKAHLEGFGSYEGVIQTKTELYRFIDGHKGTLFLNSSQPELIEQARRLHCQIIRYGLSPEDNCMGEFLESNPLLKLRIHSSSGKDPEYIDIQTQLFGSYNLDNVLASACVGNYFGIPVKEIKSAIELYRPANSRSQIVKTKKHILILDYYNANPSSMRAALDNFHSLSGYDKIVVLGDMLELGDFSESEHKSIVEILTKMDFHLAFLIGPEFCKAAAGNNRLMAFQEIESFISHLRNHPLESSAVLIKGSRGMKLEKVLENL